MDDERSKMKALFARAKATREEVAPSVPLSAKDNFTVPRCAHCGAPREVAAGQAVQGALAKICRYCTMPPEG